MIDLHKRQALPPTVRVTDVIANMTLKSESHGELCCRLKGQEFQPWCCFPSFLRRKRSVPLYYISPTNKFNHNFVFFIVVERRAVSRWRSQQLGGLSCCCKVVARRTLLWPCCEPAPLKLPRNGELRPPVNLRYTGRLFLKSWGRIFGAGYGTFLSHVGRPINPIIEAYCSLETNMSRELSIDRE
jgi:hypothetical protein